MLKNVDSRHPDVPVQQAFYILCEYWSNVGNVFIVFAVIYCFINSLKQLLLFLFQVFVVCVAEQD